MPKGTFKYTNGQNTFEKEFKAENVGEAHELIRQTLKRNGCGLVSGSIRLGRKMLPDVGPVFEPHLSPEQHILAAEQNMRRYAYEYCAPDLR